MANQPRDALGRFASTGSNVVDSLLIKLLGDDKAYQLMLDNALKETVAFAVKIDSKLQSVSNTFKQLGSNLSLFVTTPLLAFGAASVKVATDAEETQSKFEVVFSSIQKKARETAEELDRSFGMSGVAARRALADTGDLLAGFGFTQEAALDVSARVQRLAADLASFTNIQGGAARASEALTKGLLGEREMLKALGIAILDEDVKKQVVINRAKGLTYETERQENAMATLEIAIRQSKNAVGDYARTMGSLANQNRETLGDLEDISNELGKILLPTVQKIIAALKEVTNWINQLSPTTKNWLVAIAAVTAALGPLLLISGSIVSAIGTLITSFAAVKIAMATSQAVFTAVTVAVTALEFSLAGLLATAVAFSSVKLGNNLAELFSDVKNARRLQAEAEAESARLDKLMAERQSKAGASAPTGKGQTEEQVNALKSLREEIDRLNQSLQLEAATFGKTAREAKIYALEMQGASKFALRDIIAADAFITKKEKEAEAHREAAEAQKEAAKLAQRNIDNLVSQGAAVTEQFLTPVEQFNKRIEELSRLQKVGAISAETFDRAVGATGKTLQEAILEEEKGRRKSARLGAGDFVNAGSLEAKIRAEEQKDLINGNKRDDKAFRLQEKIEQHLRAIKDATTRQNQDKPVTLELANFQ